MEGFTLVCRGPVCYIGVLLEGGDVCPLAPKILRIIAFLASRTFQNTWGLGMDGGGGGVGLLRRYPVLVSSVLILPEVRSLLQQLLEPLDHLLALVEVGAQPVLIHDDDLFQGYG